MRKAAKAEGVAVIGTIGVLDQLKQKELIDRDEYVGCLSALQEHNGGRVRLPRKELKDRIELATKK